MSDDTTFEIHDPDAAARDRDVDILARTVWGEARGETFGGRVAVANVVANRVAMDLHDDGKPDWWGEGFAGICLKPWQFSCWNPGDPNRAKLQAVTEADAIFAECLSIAESAVAGRLADVTIGSTHYFAKSARRPKWARGKMPVIEIGQHLFFNDVEG